MAGRVFGGHVTRASPVSVPADWVTDSAAPVNSPRAQVFDSGEMLRLCSIA